MRNPKESEIVYKLEKLIELTRETCKLGKGTILFLYFTPSVAKFQVDADYKREKLFEYVNTVLSQCKKRFTANNILQIKVDVSIPSVSEYSVVACSFSEFFACCGKIIGYQLFLHNNRPTIATTDKLSLEDDKQITLLNCYFDIVRDILAVSPYTSLSVIVSKENGRLYSLFSNIKGFKLIHEFANQRMASKNVCKEYEFNLDY